MGESQQQALNEIKKALMSSSVLVPPCKDKKLKLYVVQSSNAIGCLIVQDWDDGKERAIYDLSRTLIGTELNYCTTEKICYPLVFAYKKPEHYMLLRETEVVSKFDLVKLILKRPMHKGQLMEWALKLAPFALTDVLIKAVKEHIIVEFLAKHPNIL